MATYITLVKFTQQGIQNVKESLLRLDRVRDAFSSAGAELKAFYSVMGSYDSVVISEAPNDETVAKLALSIGAEGNVRTETLRAFTEDEYRQMISELP